MGLEVLEEIIQANIKKEQFSPKTSSFRRISLYFDDSIRHPQNTQNFHGN